MNLLEVKVIAPSGELYNLKAKSVSSTNSAGKFDILPGHANFVTFVSGQEIDIVTDDKQQIQLEYPVAIIQVGKDKVSIFVDVDIIAHSNLPKE